MINNNIEKGIAVQSNCSPFFIFCDRKFRSKEDGNRYVRFIDMKRNKR